MARSSKTPESPKNKLTAERLRELLSYDSETGVWTTRVSSHNGRWKAGRIAGVLSRGYRVIRVDGWLYLSSRLAVLYMTGEWPAEEVDHKDTNRSNDRWLNLREATRQQNASNRPISPNNKSGLKGATFRKGRRRPWFAQIVVANRNISLGYFATKEAAHAAYCAAAREHYGEFARFQ
jgi:hypothetical protein